VVEVGVVACRTVFSEPGTTDSVEGSTDPICSSVSAGTGAGKPHASTEPGEPVNHVITTLVSVTLAVRGKRGCALPRPTGHTCVAAR
jgi:hypothetical protein